MYYTEKDKQLIDAWKVASSELKIDIITPFEINTENGKVKYPVLVKNFGRKKGTIIARHAYFMDYPMPEHKDYFFSALNVDTYSHFDRNLFIETLIDWGYLGSDENKPEWFI